SLRFAPENETQNNNTLLSFSSTPYIQSSVLPVPVLPAIEKYGVYKDFPVPRTTTFLSISCISFMVLSEQILLLITVLSKASICLDRKSTRELQSRENLVCRLLLEKKKNNWDYRIS